MKELLDAVSIDAVLLGHVPLTFFGGSLGASFLISSAESSFDFSCSSSCWRCALSFFGSCNYEFSIPCWPRPLIGTTTPTHRVLIIDIADFLN